MTAEGFLAVDKPSGPTSHDVVALVRKATGTRKAGHAGTLDPLASGLVVVALGRSTRLVRFLQDLEKEYLATACFGVATDSLDAEGSVVTREPMDIGLDDVRAVATRFVGTIPQVPPMVSALKVEGRRLYELARQGEEVERQARPVEVHELEILDSTPGPYPEVTFRVVCGKGTYVRVLADDMAMALGGRAHLRSLRRTRTGSITLDEDGVPLDLVPSRWRDALLTPSQGLSDLPSAVVDEATAVGVGHGVRFARSPLPHLGEEVPFRVLDTSGRLLAVYRSRGASAVPEVVLS